MLIDVTKPYTYAKFSEDVKHLLQRYPFVEQHIIGYSVLGKPLIALKFGRGATAVHYNGAFHANEWITSLLLMKFCEDFAAAYDANDSFHGIDVKHLYDQICLWVVPMVNPDGVNLVIEGVSPQHPFYNDLLQWNDGSDDFSNWKANIRGVDLNDQFPARWEVEKERRAAAGPAPRDYTGIAPLTEPEAIAISQLTNDQPFSLVIAFHTQGEEIYWNYQDLEPPSAERIAERLAAQSSYRAVKLQGSDAGYKDWFIQQFRRPGFTVEAGLGTNPLPLTAFDDIYRRIKPMMVVAMYEALSFIAEKG